MNFGHGLPTQMSSSSSNSCLSSCLSCSPLSSSSHSYLSSSCCSSSSSSSLPRLPSKVKFVLTWGWAGLIWWDRSQGCARLGQGNEVVELEPAGEADLVPSLVKASIDQTAASSAFTHLRSYFPPPRLSEASAVRHGPFLSPPPSTYFF